MSFQSVYEQMNLVWRLFFLAFLSCCVVEVCSCSVSARSRLLVSVDICSTRIFSFLSVLYSVCVHTCAPMCGSQRLVFGIFLSCSLFPEIGSH